MMLDDIQNIIKETILFAKSENGLFFQFRPAGVDDPYCRIIVYRVEGRPTDKELAAFRRNLEVLLPKETFIQRRKAFIYNGSDDKKRYCHPFAWLPQAQQGALLATEATTNYLEA